MKRILIILFGLFVTLNLCFAGKYTVTSPNLSDFQSAKDIELFSRFVQIQNSFTFAKPVTEFYKTECITILDNISLPSFSSSRTNIISQNDYHALGISAVFTSVAPASADFHLLQNIFSIYGSGQHLNSSIDFYAYISMIMGDTVDLGFDYEENQNFGEKGDCISVKFVSKQVSTSFIGGKF